MANPIKTPTTGFYWFYSHYEDGVPLETTPDICWYCERMNSIQTIGYDVPIEYTPDRYILLKKVEEYTP